VNARGQGERKKKRVREIYLKRRERQKHNGRERVRDRHLMERGDRERESEGKMVWIFDES
jgi:hypothetical protein